MADRFRDDPEFRKEYHRKYYLKKQKKLKSRSMRRYYRIRNKSDFKEKTKRDRELRHFGCTRESIFAKTNGICFKCKKKPAVIVHHLDGDGRTNEKKGLKPGHNPDRLIGACRSCHMKIHYKELYKARFKS